MTFERRRYNASSLLGYNLDSKPQSRLPLRSFRTRTHREGASIARGRPQSTR